MTKEEGKSLSVLKRSGIKSYIELMEELAHPGFFFVFLISMMFEEERTEYRTESKRIDCRNKDRNNQSNTELLIEYPSGSLNKGNRYEYRRHHQSNRDNCPCNLVHSRDSCRFGFLSRMFHLGMDGLDDDNRVVHHNTNSQYQSKQSKHIDRIPKKIQEEERPYNRHRHRNSRYKRRTEVL